MMMSTNVVEMDDQQTGALAKELASPRHVAVNDGASCLSRDGLAAIENATRDELQALRKHIRELDRDDFTKEVELEVNRALVHALPVGIVLVESPLVSDSESRLYEASEMARHLNRPVLIVPTANFVSPVGGFAFDFGYINGSSDAGDFVRITRDMMDAALPLTLDMVSVGRTDEYDMKSIERKFDERDADALVTAVEGGDAEALAALCVKRNRDSMDFDKKQDQLLKTMRDKMLVDHLANGGVLSSRLEDETKQLERMVTDRHAQSHERPGYDGSRGGVWR